ncbi:MAG: restriction endonuclease subunit S [Pseudomonadota bacterium]
MEVTTGYKQTEVGVIPEDWGTKSLDSVLSKGRLGGNYANQDAEAELPLMKMGNLARGYFDLSKVQFITSGVRPESVHRLVFGDVLFNTRNTLDLVGKVAIWRDELPVAYYNSNLMRLEFDPEQICSNEYANYSLNTEGAVSRLRALATGTTSVAAIYTRDLMKLQVVVPPKPEQLAIATALSDVDALLAAQDKLIAKKCDIKQAAMQQVLTGKQRLPGFSGEWEVKRLGDVAEIRKGQLITEKDAVAGDVPVIAGGKKPAYFHNKPNRTGKTITVSASGASAGYVAFFDTPIFASDCSTISEGLTYSIEFIYFQLLLNQEVIYKAQTGGAQPHIHAVDLIPLEVGSPSMAEQIAIAAVLSDMDAELTALEQQRDKTRVLKQGMMQELLTGRIRLV